MTRYRCLGIDPSYGKPIAFAYINNRGGWHTGKFAPEDVCQQRNHSFKQARARGITYAVIEGGFVGPNKKVGLKLERMRGKIEAVAEIAGLNVVQVPIKTWQTECLTTNGVTPIVHKEIIAAAKFRAKQETGKDLSEDEAVAVCIAVWGNSQYEIGY